VNSWKDHMSEAGLSGILVLLLGFVILMSHIHNDSLASKGMEYAGQVLAALLTLAVAARKLNPPTQ
jgi:hypothetical protein